MAHQRWADLPMAHPVVQAGMAGGLANAELAAAVSRAGGLGTVGLVGPAAFAAELRRARALAGEYPLAANFLMPFVRRAHVEACIDARVDAVTFFFGFDRAAVTRLHAAGIVVAHQVGSVEEAERALADGADALIAQGSEAGGHIAGTLPMEILLARLATIAGTRPVLAAGGIHDRASAARAMAAGAAGVSAGTRFLLTEESNAHPAYKARLLAATETLITRLFGLAWPALHRVAPNEATARWCAGDDLGPAWVTALNHMLEPTRRLAPMDSVIQLVALQRVSVPFYSPAALVKGMDERQIEVTPLYAGRCIREISSLASAADVVAELAAGCRDGASNTAQA